MKVFIVHRDIDYEFGEVYDVCSSKSEAEAELKLGMDNNTTDTLENWSIQEWEVLCPKCNGND